MLNLLDLDYINRNMLTFNVCTCFCQELPCILQKETSHFVINACKNLDGFGNFPCVLN